MTVYTGLYYYEDIVYMETSSLDTSIFNNGTVLYEVLRIIDGTALFLEDHIQRLQHSADLSGFSHSVSVPLIHYLLRNLIKKNNTANGNVKIILHFREGKLPAIYTFFVPHFYPSAEMYEKGANAALFQAERINPNIKKIRPEVFERISAFIKDLDIYDVILVDENDCITEGSKTNVFLISGNSIITAPGETVLKGITRNKIFDLCKRLNINLIEQVIPTKSLKESDAVFFSGTSPKILPVSRIGSLGYKAEHPLMRMLMKAYEDLISDYIHNN